MGELLKNDFLLRALATAFTALFIFLVSRGIFIQTREMDKLKRKTLLRVGISSVLVCFWLYCFIYRMLYPISLAYYEFQKGLSEETIGVVECIEQQAKDRIYLTIDGVEYTLVHSSTDPYVRIGIDIAEGDVVHIVYGENSMYIFDIREAKDSP